MEPTKFDVDRCPGRPVVYGLKLADSGYTLQTTCIKRGQKNWRMSIWNGDVLVAAHVMNGVHNSVEAKGLAIRWARLRLQDIANAAHKALIRLGDER